MTTAEMLRKEGWIEGKIEGKMEFQEEIALKMIREGEQLTIIMEYTQLTRTHIEALKLQNMTP